MITEKDAPVSGPHQKSARTFEHTFRAPSLSPGSGLVTGMRGRVLLVTATERKVRREEGFGDWVSQSPLCKVPRTGKGGIKLPSRARDVAPRLCGCRRGQQPKGLNLVNYARRLTSVGSVSRSCVTPAVSLRARVSLESAPRERGLAKGKTNVLCGDDQVVFIDARVVGLFLVRAVAARVHQDVVHLVLLSQPAAPQSVSWMDSASRLVTRRLSPSGRASCCCGEGEEE